MKNLLLFLKLSLLCSSFILISHSAQAQVNTALYWQESDLTHTSYDKCTGQLYVRFVVFKRAHPTEFDQALWNGELKLQDASGAQVTFLTLPDFTNNPYTGGTHPHDHEPIEDPSFEPGFGGTFNFDWECGTYPASATCPDVHYSYMTEGKRILLEVWLDDFPTSYLGEDLQVRVTGDWFYEWVIDDPMTNPVSTLSPSPINITAIDPIMEPIMATTDECNSIILSNKGSCNGSKISLPDVKQRHLPLFSCETTCRYRN